MTTTSKPVSILRNSAWSGASAAIGICILIFTTPAYLQILGEDTFGLYMLLVAVTAPFDILNAGVAQATVKHLAAWIPHKRLAESRAMLQINLLFNCTAAAIAVLSLYFLSPYLAESVFKISKPMQADAVACFRLASVLWATKLIGASLATVNQALQNFRLQSIVQTASLVALYLGGLPVAYHYRTVASLQLWGIAVAVMVAIFWMPRIARLLGWSAILPAFERTSFRLSFGYSSWQMLNAMANMIAQQSDRVLLGILLGTGPVAIYGIAVGIQQRLVQLIWSLFGTLFPAISRHVENEPREAEEILYTKGAIITLVSGWLCGVGVLFSRPFCIIWLGPATGEATSTLLALLFLTGMASLPYALLLQYILGRGLTKLIFLGNIVFCLVSSVISFFAIRNLGLNGAVIGTLIGFLVSATPIHWWLCLHHLKEGNSAFDRFWRIYSPAISVAVSTALAALCILATIGINPSLPASIIAGTISAAGMVVCSVLLECLWSHHTRTYRNAAEALYNFLKTALHKTTDH